MKAWEIVAYTFRADLYCPECVADHVAALPVLSTHGGARRQAYETTENYLDRLGGVLAVDRADERSYDTEDFPKVVFASDLDHDLCGECGADVLSA